VNPYSTSRIWPPEVHAAYASMPKNKFGQTVSLFYALPNELVRLENEWREWAKKHKGLHPKWFKDWAEHKRKTAPIYVKGQESTTESVNVP
jgi:hypothetical protein